MSLAYRSVVIYGPQGCGKTRNAETLRTAYRLDRVIEADDHNGRSPLDVPATGALVLVCDPADIRIPEGVVTLPFNTAMRRVKAGAK